MGYAIIFSWPYSGKCDSVDPIKFWPEMETLLSTIQSLLLANLGVILGISISKPESPLARAVLFSNKEQLKALSSVQDPIEIKDRIQLFALWVFLIVLIACLITWIKNDFCTKPSEIIPIVHESGKMFFGVVLGYLTIILRK